MNAEEAGHRPENCAVALMGDGASSREAGEYPNFVKNASAVVVSRNNDSIPRDAACASANATSDLPRPWLRCSGATASERKRATEPNTSSPITPTRLVSEQLPKNSTDPESERSEIGNPQAERSCLISASWPMDSVASRPIFDVDFDSILGLW